MSCFSLCFTARCRVLLFSKGSLQITRGFTSKAICVLLSIDVLWVLLGGKLTNQNKDDL